jgi:hypothetical protein
VAGGDVGVAAAVVGVAGAVVGVAGAWVAVAAAEVGVGGTAVALARTVAVEVAVRRGGVAVTSTEVAVTSTCATGEGAAGDSEMDGPWTCTARGTRIAASAPPVPRVKHAATMLMAVKKAMIRVRLARARANLLCCSQAPSYTQVSYSH